MNHPNLQSLRSAEQRQLQANMIVDGLSEPDYLINKQPNYPDRQILADAIAENLSISGVTNPVQARSLTQEIANLSDPNNEGFIVLSGACRESIRVDEDIKSLGETSEVALAIVASSSLRKVIPILRNRGQYGKPRSVGYVSGPNDIKIPAYQGDSINGNDLAKRTPEPKRLVGGAIQAKDLELELTKRMGHHVYAAHEALVEAYEQPFIRLDPDSRQYYSESADLLWAGLRTNQLDSVVIAMLKGVQNTVGVKIGANSDERHIAGLSKILNPDNKPGRLVYMLRLGLREEDKYSSILNAMAEHAPQSIAMFDAHGITETAKDGTKIRNVLDIMKGIGVMNNACQAAGVRFGGLHLETITDGRRQECVDEYGQPPLHIGDIDPGLNPRQTVKVLNHTASLIG
ncbi:MAG: hypothetical protein NVS1B10_06110 [Candidatus Saccharimonadales bacterium]